MGFSDPTAPSQLAKLNTTPDNILATILKGSVSHPYSVAFSPDSGGTLASGNWDNTIILWDVSDPTAPSQLARLEGHSPVDSVTFSPDGKTLASGNQDNTIILWDVSNLIAPSQLARLEGHSSTVNSLTFSPDGTTLASGSGDKAIILWDMDPLSWVKKACQRVGRNFTLAEWAQYFSKEDYRKTCEQWPKDLDYYRQVVEQSLADLSDPQQIQVALDEIRNEMESDYAEYASTNLAEWITSEIISEKAAGNWQKALDLLELINTSFEDPPVDSSFLRAEITYSIKREILGEARNGNWQEAQDLLELAEKNNLLVEDDLFNSDVPTLNAICWFGSLKGYASQVLKYCELAVELFPDAEGFRDSRGLARALTGDIDGAIRDFQYYVDHSDKSDSIEKRKQWIIELEAGKNPFTEDLLKELLEEE